MTVTSLACYAIVVVLAGNHEVQTNASAAGGAFEMTRSVIAAGGGFSNGGNFSLYGTAGQAATGASFASGSVIRAGFWGAAGGALVEHIFVNGFESD